MSFLWVVSRWYNIKEVVIAEKCQVFFQTIGLRNFSYAFYHFRKIWFFTIHTFELSLIRPRLVSLNTLNYLIVLASDHWVIWFSPLEYCTPLFFTDELSQFWWLLLSVVGRQSLFEVRAIDVLNPRLLWHIQFALFD